MTDIDVDALEQELKKREHPQVDDRWACWQLAETMLAALRQQQSDLKSWFDWSVSKGPGLEAYREQQMKIMAMDAEIARLRAVIKTVVDILTTFPSRRVQNATRILRKALENEPPRK